MNLARRFHPFATVSAALAAVVLGTAVSLAHDPEQHAMRAQPAQWSKQLDARFLENAMDRHAMVARMGKLARKRSVHAELRAWGDTLAFTYAAEVKRIEGLLLLGYGRSHVPLALKVPHPLEKLKGTAFEQEFLRQMLLSHGAALAETKDCRSLAADTRLHKLCGDFVESQQREITTMGNWLCQWYQKCE